MKPYHGVDAEPKTSLAVGQEAPSQCGHGVTSAVGAAVGGAIVATTGTRGCGRSNRMVTNVLISQCR